MLQSIENFLKRTLQKLLGFENYLYIFSIFTYNRLKIGLIEEEFLYFIKLVPREGTILDIGANIGVMSTMMAKKFPQSKIVSFEPITENIKVFKRVKNHYSLSNVTLNEVAVGDSTGTIQMVMPEEANVRLHGLSKVASAEDKGATYDVPLIKIDDVPQLNEPGVKITAIKIDVENYEFFALKGAEKLLRKHMPVIYCELWDNQNRVNVIGLLSGMGYLPKVFDNGTLVDFANQKVMNFIFLPPGTKLPS